MSLLRDVEVLRRREEICRLSLRLASLLPVLRIQDICDID